MKYCYLLAILFVFLLSGCDKENPAPGKTSQEILKQEISEALASQIDLTDFAAVFDDVELSAEDVANGVTVFAPGDANSGGRMTSDQQAGSLTPSMIKGHIVKGLINASDLKHGDILKALDGRDLVVSVDGDAISINGVGISSEDLVKTDKFIIHKVEAVIGDLQQGPVAITVTVWNSVLWSLENPKGKPDAGVAVAFYASREDFPDGDAVYSGETDAEGKVVFPDAVPGATYYIYAEKGEISNVFDSQWQPVEEELYGYIPEGIFQTYEEVNSQQPAQGNAAPGNLRWRDLNGDGVVNSDDRGLVPHPAVTAVASNTEVEVFIGFYDNDAMFIRDEEDAYATFRGCIGRTYAWYQRVVMLDGIISDEAECPPSTPWCPIDNLTHDPTNIRIMYLWDVGYSNIEELNLLLRDVPGLAIDGKERLIADVKGLRGFTYLHLVTYFGDVPIPENVWLARTDVRNPKNEVYELIKADLESALAVLPAGPFDDRSMLTTDALKVLLARTALLNGDFARVDALTTEVIEDARYTLLASAGEAFANNTNPEIIWDLSFNRTQEFKDYFFDRPFGPALRLAQVYLMKAEAQIELNNFAEARATLDIIRTRLGLSPASGMLVDELRAELRETWTQEMSREGDRFMNLVRWGLADDILMMQGYDLTKHDLLPIPQVILERYYNLYQNPGY